MRYGFTFYITSLHPYVTFPLPTPSSMFSHPIQCGEKGVKHLCQEQKGRVMWEMEECRGLNPFISGWEEEKGRGEGEFKPLT